MSFVTSWMGAPVLPLVALDPHLNAYPAGRHLGDVAGLSHVNTDLISDNVRAGINIFGVIGDMDYYQRYIGASLYQSVLASKVTVSRNIAKTKAILIGIGDYIYMNKIENYTIFDWIGVMEKAQSIHTVGTSIVFLMDAFDSMPKEMHLYSRIDKPHSTYDFLLKKEYIYH